MSHLSPQLLTELNAAITQLHLEPLADEIRSSATECLAMVTMGEDDYSQVGNTRFGGDPDLPAGMDWPTDPDMVGEWLELYGVKYSNFIAQINFAELPRLSADTGLPHQGILYVFVQSLSGAGYPVILDTLYFDGDLASLSRRPSPQADSLCDDCLVDLVPQRMRAVPSLSFPNYKKHYQQAFEDKAPDIKEERRKVCTYDLDNAFFREGQIGQMLGYANAADERDNLYRNVVLSQLDKRDFKNCHYWETMQDYETWLEDQRAGQRSLDLEALERESDALERDQLEHDQRESARDQLECDQRQRIGVEWLTSNAEMLATAADQWRLLLQIESGPELNLWINDADPLYVFIHEADLARRCFSNLAGEVTQG